MSEAGRPGTGSCGRFVIALAIASVFSCFSSIGGNGIDGSIETMAWKAGLGREGRVVRENVLLFVHLLYDINHRRYV